MDRGIKDTSHAAADASKKQADADLLERRLEATIEIMMDHLRETEDRLEAMEEKIDALSKDGD